MVRKTIERTPAGKLVKYPDGLEEFAEKVAEDLLNQFPDVDFTDLEMCFNKLFGHRFLMAFLRETAERI